jgi:DNA-binding protein YbaB
VPEDIGRDIGATERMVREWQERATEKAEKFGRMQQQIEEIAVTESSKDGAITVTIASSGTLQDLSLAENAGNRPMAKLGAEIMRLVQTAQAKIPDRMQEAVAGTVGLDDTAAQHVLGQARAHFPEPPDDEPITPNDPRANEVRPEQRDDYQPPRRKRGVEDGWDDDFGNGSFLR